MSRSRRSCFARLPSDDGGAADALIRTPGVRLGSKAPAAQPAVARAGKRCPRLTVPFNHRAGIADGPDVGRIATSHSKGRSCGAAGFDSPGVSLPSDVNGDVQQTSALAPSLALQAARSSDGTALAISALSGRQMDVQNLPALTAIPSTRSSAAMGRLCRHR